MRLAYKAYYYEYRFIYIYGVESLVTFDGNLNQHSYIYILEAFYWSK